MKPRLLLPVLLVLVIIGVYGQRPTITLTFTADKNGQHVPLSSIRIENLTREVDTMLYAPDTVLVVDYLVGINENQHIGSDGFYLSQNYPNPLDGHTAIDLFLPETENLRIIVSDMLGRELLNRNYRLETGNHSFTFYPGNESLYFLTARTNRHSQTIKMINQPIVTSPANSTLEYKGLKSGIDGYKSGNEETNFVYYLGDQLKYAAFADEGERVITDSPTENQSYVFFFGGVPCPDAPTVTDVDGNVYRTVLIGDQCWMAENLKVGTMINANQEMTNNGIIEKYCFNNEVTNCGIYGGLYQWAEMMNYTNSSGAQGICPEGWHLPTDTEWCILEVEVDTAITCNIMDWRGIDGGGKLKEEGTTHWYSPNAGATNSSGFTGLPGGIRYNNGNIDYIGFFSSLWSSTENSANYALYRALGYHVATIVRNVYPKDFGFSVRCLRDDE